MTLCHGDITAQELDVIFAPVPFRKKTTSLLSEAVKQQAGGEYESFLENVVDKKPGYAVIAPAGNLPSRHVIACVTPKWDGGFMGEDRALVHCFENALQIAMDQGWRSVGIPVFLTGNHGYPKPRAVRLAVKTVFDTVQADLFDEIRFVAFKEDVFELFKERLERYGWMAQEA